MKFPWEQYAHTKSPTPVNPNLSKQKISYKWKETFRDLVFVAECIAVAAERKWVTWGGRRVRRSFFGWGVEGKKRRQNVSPFFRWGRFGLDLNPIKFLLQFEHILYGWVSERLAHVLQRSCTCVCARRLTLMLARTCGNEKGISGGRCGARANFAGKKLLTAALVIWMCLLQ